MSFLDTIRGVFEVDEAGGRVAVRMIRRDGGEEVAFAGRPDFYFSGEEGCLTRCRFLQLGLE